MMTVKAQKRLERLLRLLDRAATEMKHPDLRPLVGEWNGDRNLLSNIVEFVDWQTKKLERT